MRNLIFSFLIVLSSVSYAAIDPVSTGDSLESDKFNQIINEVNTLSEEAPIPGPQGIQGIKGDTGLTGDQGPQGIQGLSGANGSQGVKGDTGLTGAQGIQGPQGDIGPQGPAGSAASGPVGSVIIMPGNCPSGYLDTDGSSLSRTTYASLFAYLGTTHGSVDSNTFNIPDYRGLFLRMVDGTKGNDPDKTARTAMNAGGATGNAVGSVQSDMYASHSHVINAKQETNSGGSDHISSSTPGGIAYTYNTVAAGGNETRPKNAYVKYCIKSN